MALKACRECKTQVSDEAKICPNCGIKSPTRAPTSVGKMILVVLGGFMLVGVIAQLSGPSTSAPASAPPSPGQTAAQKARDTQLTLAVTMELALKRAARNPDSLKVSEVLAMEGGAVCMTYRAQNGFGGMNLEKAVGVGTRMINSTDDAFASAWNKNCAGKSGSDVTDEAARALSYVDK